MPLALQSMAAVSELAVTTSLSKACARIAAGVDCCSELLMLIKAFQRGGASANAQQQLFHILGKLLPQSEEVEEILMINVGLLASQLQTTRDHEVIPCLHHTCLLAVGLCAHTKAIAKLADQQERGL